MARNRRPRAKQPPPPPKGLTPVKRVLAAYLIGAMLIAVVVLVGIATLGGSLGPAVVALVAVLAAIALQRWTALRIAGADLEPEDQTLRAAATGLLVLGVAFAVVAAIALALV